MSTQSPDLPAPAAQERPPTVHSALSVRHDPSDQLDRATSQDRATLRDRATLQDRATSQEVAEVEARKLSLRRSVRAQRRARTAQTAAEQDAALARVLLSCPLVAGARRVACYTSLPGEPGTRAILTELRRNGIEVLLPVLMPDADLDWEVRPVRTGAGAHRGPGRLGPHAVASVDLVVVPALAVDTSGHRLGQGGGSYDRALRRVPPRVPVLAVVHDEEFFDAAVTPLPTLAHDRPVQAVVTPTRWLRLAT